DAGVVDQDVEVGRVGGELAHALEVREVEPPDVGGAVDGLRRFLALGGVADGEDDVSSVLGQRGGGAEADAAGGARDNEGAAGLIRDVLGGPVAHGVVM